MGREDRLVVVGGGVIGAACAYYAAESGWQVTVIDQGAFGGGCSHGNCGFVCPSHILPLTSPGALREGVKTLLTPNAPLKIRLRFDPALWSWLLQFARRCNRRDMLATARAMQPMFQASRAMYDQLLRDELADCEWQTRGLLFVYRTEKLFEAYAATDRLLREQFDLPATRYTGDQLVRFEPALLPGLAGGWHYATDAHLRPEKLMAAWRRRLEARGVAIQEDTALCDLTHVRHVVRSVETSRGPLAAEAVIVAAGAWTPTLRKQLGCRIPIQPGKGYSITMPRPRQCPQIPLIFEEHVAVTPMQTGYRIGSTMELAGYDASLNPRRLKLLTDAVPRYLHEPLAEPVLERWQGWRPMTYDGRPVIGRLPAYDNVLLATGHGMLGVSLAPSTGKLAAELLNGQTPHLDPAPFSVERFL